MAEIDKSTAEILSLKTIDDLSQFEMGDVKMLSSQIIKIFYRCLVTNNEIQHWNDVSLQAQCSKAEQKISLKIETDIWTISGFIKL